jgi:hypothetical protein
MKETEEKLRCNLLRKSLKDVQFNPSVFPFSIIIEGF